MAFKEYDVTQSIEDMNVRQLRLYISRGAAQANERLKTMKDIPAYLADKGWENIHFALDTKDKLVWNLVGGGPAMPQTIVLDRDGKVIYNQVGSVTPELLESLYSQAAK